MVSKFNTPLVIGEQFEMAGRAGGVEREVAGRVESLHPSRCCSICDVAGSREAEGGCNVAPTIRGQS